MKLPGLGLKREREVSSPDGFKVFVLVCVVYVVNSCRVTETSHLGYTTPTDTVVSVVLSNELLVNGICVIRFRGLSRDRSPRFTPPIVL